MILILTCRSCLGVRTVLGYMQMITTTAAPRMACGPCRQTGYEVVDIDVAGVEREVPYDR